MEEIYSNFSKLEWWFNGLFFAVIAAIIPFIYSRVITYLGKNIIIKPLRRQRARLLKRVKIIRRDDIRIQYEISKSTALLAAFITSMIVYAAYAGIIITIMSHPVEDISDLDSSYMEVWMISCFPLFLLEIIYLRSRFFVDILLLRRNRLLKKRG